MSNIANITRIMCSKKCTSCPCRSSLPLDGCGMGCFFSNVPKLFGNRRLLSFSQVKITVFAISRVHSSARDSVLVGSTQNGRTCLADTEKSSASCGQTDGLTTLLAASPDESVTGSIFGWDVHNKAILDVHSSRGIEELQPQLSKRCPSEKNPSEPLVFYPARTISLRTGIKRKVIKDGKSTGTR